LAFELQRCDWQEPVDLSGSRHVRRKPIEEHAMNIKKILVPTDFSEPSEAALFHATALARQANAVLLIAHVHEPVEVYTDTGFAGYPVAGGEEALERTLEEVRPPDAQVGYVHRMLHGNAADEITRLAENEDVDMIVMGTHGRSGLTRLLMGSVAEAVVRRAKCPVLTVKQPSPVSAS
jgi:nucleotide-binding universal stress UspA family protein